MPKVMLVEDDNNLREIYDARLAAEGYQIVSAHDGEEALALAVKERPDLIISDVMMPKISGFDMLDILRSTPETKNTKVIMMTALGQAEDRARADKLGADRYLVKSQVTLEDVIKVAHEVLGDSAPTPAPAAQPAAATPQADIPVVAAPPVATPPPAPAATPTPAPVVAPPVPPVAEPVPAPAAVAPPVPTPAPEPTHGTVTDAPEIVATPDAAPKAAPAPAPAPAAPLEMPVPTVSSAPAVPDEVKNAPTPIADNLTKTKEQEVATAEKQIQDFIANGPGTAEPPKDSAPTPPTQDELANPNPSANSSSIAEAPSHKKLILTPTENALAPAVDLNALLAKEEAKDTAGQPVATPETNSVIAPEVTAAPDAGSSTTNPNDIAL